MGDVKLEDLIDLMIRKRVLRVQMPDTTEVELHPSAFAAPASIERGDPSTTDSTDRCRCGHSFAIEHNQMGCLLGCSNSLCAGEQEARA